VEREAQEGRRALAVERERLTKDAAERHSAAVEETRRLLADAEERVDAAERRAADATTQANRQRAEATAEAERVAVRARREAEQIVAAARQQAKQIQAHEHADVGRSVEATRAELAALQKRRDGIVAQLVSLHELVASFHSDDDHSDDDHSDDEPVDGGDEQTHVVASTRTDEETQVIPAARDS
ncbi:MAG: hypothetical protein M3P83_09365, partial [Actinomycetota bacterium]|nr:hypothetical protein [Actinomycetota bacterium]